MSKRLREGFTTGSAAAAAAMAAVTVLFGGDPATFVDIPLPPFSGTSLKAPARLTIPVEAVTKKGDYAVARVIKDGGDDPDATNGLRVTVSASFCAFPHPGRGAFLLQGKRFTLSVATGRGIGMVTLPGLPVPAGEPAYNPEPRKQLYAAVAEAIPRDFTGVIHLFVEAPEGLGRAAKTLNPRLGIMGGISILGTHGTVKPYSHEAFTASISQGLDVAKALGLDTVLLSTGRRSERLLFSLYPKLCEQSGVQVADYAAHALRECSAKRLSHAVWGCFPGKLVKLAQGLEWTHASQGNPDMSLLYGTWVEAGGDVSLMPDILSMPTTAGAFALMEQSGEEAYRKVIRLLGCRAHGVLSGWIRGGHTGISLHVFSMEGEHLLHVGEDGHVR